MSKTVLKKIIPVALAACVLCSVGAPLAGVRTATADAAAAYHAKVDARDPVAVLSRLGETHGANVREEYRFERALDVAYGTVYRFRQVKDGADVLGEEIIVSADRAGNVLSVDGRYVDTHAMKEGSLSLSAACKAAGEGRVLSAKKAVFAGEGGPMPAYEVVTDAGGGRRVVVSALDGAILSQTSLASSVAVGTTQTDAFGEQVDVEVEQEGDTYLLVDRVRNIFVYDAKGGSWEGANDLFTSASGTFEDAMAVSVFRNMVTAYDFYTVEENIGAVRRGINNGNNEIAGDNESRSSEIELNVYVHVNAGGNRENAAFNGTARPGTGLMIVGDGDPDGKLYRQGRALDVIAHEYQHGVTQYTAGLVYEGQPGAINEAVSDIFGALVEGHSPEEEEFWLVGEDGVPAGAPAQRSMKAPSGTQSSSVRNMFVCNEPGNHALHNCDDNGVHRNSTILSHMQYRIWQAMPAFFTRERIGTLWYSTLCTLSSNTTFKQFGEKFRQAAERLGYDEEALAAVDYGLYCVGLLDELEGYHRVTFVDYEGAVVQETVVRDGQTEAVTPPELPARPSTDAYHYEFLGWDREDFSDLHEDVTVRPRYREQLRSYTVTFLDREGGVIGTQSVPYGSGATAPDVPLRESVGAYDYDFLRWDAEFGNITGDLTVRAQYASTRCYTVRFMSEGTLIGSARVREGEDAPPPSETPEKASDERFDYTFDGWSGSLRDVREDRTLNAVFRETPRRYTVTFVSGEETLRSESLAYGETVSLPEPPPREGYVFEGWYLDEALTAAAEQVSVEGDLTLYAKWSKKKKGCGAVIGGVGGAVALAVLACGAVLLVRRKG